MNFTALYERSQWNACSSDERRAIALAIAERLGTPFLFVGLKTHSLGGMTQELAFFAGFDSEFALIPGESAALLGYDPDSPYAIREALREEFRENTTPELQMSLEDYLEVTMMPRRAVAISPFLLEVQPCTLDYIAQEARGTDEDDTVAPLLGDTLRLPTVDEWEYACAAGTRTLFHWGDDCPDTNCYFEETWDLHQRPNSFGLRMNADTYQVELCEGEKFRGGDSGCSVCGGFGNFYSWLPLASSSKASDGLYDPCDIDQILLRRALSLPL